ncbi:MAG: uncharacterized protein QG612_2622 [Pseudomonadota bacterium]|nr:uncharacterized protein [Pseudomonadota bacterium]
MKPPSLLALLSLAAAGASCWGLVRALRARRGHRMLLAAAQAQFRASSIRVRDSRYSFDGARATIVREQVSTPLRERLSASPGVCHLTIYATNELGEYFVFRSIGEGSGKLKHLPHRRAREVLGKRYVTPRGRRIPEEDPPTATSPISLLPSALLPKKPAAARRSGRLAGARMPPLRWPSGKTVPPPPRDPFSPSLLAEAVTRAGRVPHKAAPPQAPARAHPALSAGHRMLATLGLGLLLTGLVLLRAFDLGQMALSAHQEALARPLFLLAALRGHAKAQNQLAGLYAKGRDDTPADYAQARYWYEKAAAQDHPQALLDLGSLHVAGVLPGADHERGLRLMARAATFPETAEPARLRLEQACQQMLLAASASSMCNRHRPPLQAATLSLPGAQSAPRPLAR